MLLVFGREDRLVQLHPEQLDQVLILIQLLVQELHDFHEPLVFEQVLSLAEH